MSAPLGAHLLRSTLRLSLPLVIVTMTFIAFLPVLDAGFLSWDDKTNLVDNPHYRGLGWTQLRWMFTTTRLGHYVPITWVSFGINYLLGGMDPRGYHLANLLLHAANAGVFYVVARRLLTAAFDGSVAAGTASGHRRDISMSVGAAFAALIFGVHPLRVESVAWVTERRDVLCGLFSLLTLAAYLTAHRHGKPARLDPGWYWTSVGCFGLALLSKSTAVSLPLVLLVIDVYPLGRVSIGGPARGTGVSRLVVEKLPFLAMSVAISATMVISGWRHILTPLTALGVSDRLAISAYGMVFYLSKTVLPWPLSPLYELRHPVLPLAPRYLIPTIAVVTITAAVIVARRRWPAGLAAWLAYVLFLLPVIGIAHNGMQIVADRYSYLSCLGFAVLAGGALAWLLRERGRFTQPVVIGVVLAATLVIGGSAASAWRQSKIWRDSETLWRWAADLDPDCVVCSINLGTELTTTPEQHPSRAREAEALFRHAIELNADRDFAYHGLGVALASQRRYEEAEAAFREYMRREPSSVVGFIDMGQLYLSQHRYDEAIPFLRRAFALRPAFPRLATVLEQALRERGEELRRAGREGDGDTLLAEAAALQGSAKGDAVPPSERSGTTKVR